jgi:hypothetical protein
MATSLEHAAKREHVGTTTEQAEAQMREAIRRAQQLPGAGTPPPTAPQPPAAARVPLQASAPGFNAQDFVRDHRIQVQSSRQDPRFVDGYLVLHPGEFKPENEARLREKLRLTFTVNNPSFFESFDRRAVALNLGTLLPTSSQATHGRLLEEIKQYNSRLEQGGSDLKKRLEDYDAPFAAIVRETLEKPAQNPVDMELLKNSLSMYMLLRESLTQRGYKDVLTRYVNRAHTPDQVISDLADKIGVSPKQVRDAAAHGGLNAVGKLLGLDPHYVEDVKRLSDYAATQDFGFNIIEHWHMGRELLGIGAPMAQKISTGLEARIEAKFQHYRETLAKLYPNFEVPEAIQKEEKRIAEALNLVEPIQRALMHKLGYEICYTPEMYSDAIAFYPGIYGLHRRAAKDLRDTLGTYRIYFSGRGDLKGSMRTLVHEIAHNLWPEQFSAAEIKTIDGHCQADAERFAKFKKLLDEKFTEFDKFLRAYQAGSDAEKAAIVQTTKAYFSGYGVSIDEGVLPYLRDANEFRYLVSYAHDRLTIEGEFYSKSGYHFPSERMREVISRFAELKQVELSGNPQLMQFLAPGLNQVWEAHYIPHLERMHGQLLASEKTAADAIAKAKGTSRDAVASGNVTQLPKVEQRPAPRDENIPASTGTSACMAETPRSQIDAASAMPDARIASALGTLQHMGIASVR